MFWGAYPDVRLLSPEAPLLSVPIAAADLSVRAPSNCGLYAHG